MENPIQKNSNGEEFIPETPDVMRMAKERELNWQKNQDCGLVAYGLLSGNRLNGKFDEAIKRQGSYLESRFREHIYSASLIYPLTDLSKPPFNERQKIEGDYSNKDVIEGGTDVLLEMRSPHDYIDVVQKMVERLRKEHEALSQAQFEQTKKMKEEGKQFDIAVDEDLGEYISPIDGKAHKITEHNRILQGARNMLESYEHYVQDLEAVLTGFSVAALEAGDVGTHTEAEEVIKKISDTWKELKDFNKKLVLS